MTSRLLDRPPLGDLRARTDAELMGLARDLAALRRVIDADQALIAGEIARRSDRSLGYQGLAAREGARTVEKLVSKLTGVSVPEARSMVTVGAMEDTGFLTAVTAAVAEGDLSVGAAAAIREGLGEPNADIDAGQLEIAARRLAEDAITMSPGEAARAARHARDELDAAGVSDRAAAQRARRFLRLYPQPDGMTRVTGLLDPESAALVTDAFDRVTMPRRGGPRFVDNPLEQARDERAETDTRTIEQTYADAFVQFILMAAGVDDGTVFGVKAPAVRLHVRTDSTLGYFEGQTSPVDTDTIHRHVCTSGAIPILFDDTGQALNLGRQIRPFTTRQRIVIAARDGGCMAPGCDRPPSWTEAHHCHEWANGGTTDLTNGISLCRHHHMWIHDTHRWITHEAGTFWLHTSGETPVELRSKHPLHQPTDQRSHALTT